MPKVFLTSHEKELAKIDEALAGAMGEKHLKQVDIARKLGRSPSSASRMLHNLENMRIGDLLRICEMTNRKVTIVKRGETFD